MEFVAQVTIATLEYLTLMHKQSEVISGLWFSGTERKSNNILKIVNMRKQLQFLI